MSKEDTETIGRLLDQLTFNNEGLIPAIAQQFNAFCSIIWTIKIFCEYGINRSIDYQLTFLSWFYLVFNPAIYVYNSCAGIEPRAQTSMLADWIGIMKRYNG